ncbi:unnamed protein product, partial [Rotaria magnacalcarata]
RGSGAGTAGCAGLALQRTVPELCRTEPSRQPLGPCLDRAGCRPGQPGGRGNGALGGDGRWPVGDPQGRRCLRARGPGIPQGTPVLHAGGQCGKPGAQPASLDTAGHRQRTTH